MKRIVSIVTAVVVILVGGVAGIGWFYSDQLRTDALEIPGGSPRFPLVVADLDATGRSVTLRATDAADPVHGDWRHPGTFGLVGEDGAAAITGNIIERDDTTATRRLPTPADGFAEGDSVRLSARTFRTDPRSDHGIDFENVTFESDIGELDAWMIAGPSPTWAIYVHGRGVGREEGLRILPTLVDLGMPTLMITYRNDPGAPATDNGWNLYGLTEWRDVEAAVGYAHEAGAGDVILVGYSMGGGIVANFLFQSELAASVHGVILDSPALDLSDIVDYGAERLGLPAPLTWIGKTTAALRFGLDWGAFDYVSRAEEYDAPILLIHGDADRTVHVRTSDALASARPDLVTYVRPEGVGHVRAWNADPAAYDAAVRGFIEPLLLSTAGRSAAGASVR